MKKLPLLLFFTSFFSCDAPSTSPPKANTSKLGDTHGDLAGVADALHKKDTTISTNWTYTEKEDKMTSKKEYLASVMGSESLHLSFPYAGSNYPSILLQTRRGISSALITVEKGQILERDIHVRFDSAKMQTYEGGTPGDGDSKYLFITPSRPFITRLKKAKHVIIEAQFFDNGIQQMEFDVEGLKWNH